MSPRRYQMKQRADSAVDTRRRIVEATAALHARKGVGATTFREIAQAADVGIGTVYHHFPTYDDVITACGHHTMTLARPPQPAIFEDVEGTHARVRLLVREIFGFYQRLPQFGRIRAERRQFTALDHGFRHEEQGRRALVAEALRGTRAGTRLRAVVFALVDHGVYDNLRAALDHEAAVDEITSTILARLSAKGSRR